MTYLYQRVVLHHSVRLMYCCIGLVYRLSAVRRGKVDMSRPPHKTPDELMKEAFWSRMHLSSGPKEAAAGADNKRRVLCGEIASIGFLSA